MRKFLPINKKEDFKGVVELVETICYEVEVSLLILLPLS